MDENEDLKPVLYVCSLPWRSSKVNKLFSVLDSQIEKGKSKRALSQTYTWVVGDVSVCPKPSDLPGSFWGFANINIHMYTGPESLNIGYLLFC